MLLFFIGMICLIWRQPWWTIWWTMWEGRRMQIYRDNHNVIGTVALLWRKHGKSSGILFASSGSCQFGTCTNILLLFVGAICFFIGVFYTFGPIPISQRMPRRWNVIRLLMGQDFLDYDLGVLPEGQSLQAFGVRRKYFNDAAGPRCAIEGSSIIVTIRCTLQLSCKVTNNVIWTDITNHRYTLVYYIGRKQALVL